MADRETLITFPTGMRPDEISIRCCPECGADDRFTSLGSKRHYRFGKLCRGTPHRLVYRFDRMEDEE